MTKPMDDHYKLFIGGEWLAGKEGKTFNTYSPINGELLATCVDAGKEDVDLAVNAAWEAYKTWKDVSREERFRLLLRLADKLDENSMKLATIESMDSGMVIRETSLMIPGGNDQFRYYAAAMKTDEGSINLVDNNSMNLIFREPIGVVGLVLPWNIPYGLGLWKIAPAIAAGNTVVFKPSSETPLSILEFAKVVAEVLPPGVINVITGRGSTAGNYMLAHDGFRKLSFTGSTDVGYNVAKAAAEKIIPATLELGGKSANIIFPDCNWEKAVEGVAIGILPNQGQLCIGGSRVLVHEQIYDRFLADCVAFFNSVKVGDSLDMSSQMGPVNNASQLKSILSYVEIGKQEGARVACGGCRMTDNGLDRGYFIKPTILADVDNSWRVAREEIFGPVACFIKFKDEADAIRIANDSPYGLGGGVWTQDINRAIQVSRAIETGMMWVNCYYAVPHGMPFGGYKKSGIGRENHHKLSLDSYTQVKTIHVNLNPDRLGWYAF